MNNHLILPLDKKETIIRGDSPSPPKENPTISHAAAAAFSVAMVEWSLVNTEFINFPDDSLRFLLWRTVNLFPGCYWSLSLLSLLLVLFLIMSSSYFTNE